MTSKWSGRLGQNEEATETVEHLHCHYPTLIDMRHMLMGEQIIHDLSSFYNTELFVIFQLAKILKWLKKRQ